MSSAEHCFGWTLSRRIPEPTGQDAGLRAGFVRLLFFFLIGQNNLLNSKYVTAVPQGTKRLGCLLKQFRMYGLLGEELCLARPPAPALPGRSGSPGQAGHRGRGSARSPGRAARTLCAPGGAAAAQPLGGERARGGHGGLARVGARRAAGAAQKQPAPSERKSLG